MINIDFDGDEANDTCERNTSTDNGPEIFSDPPFIGETKENSDPWEINSDDFDDLIDEETLVLLNEEDDDVMVIADDDSVAETKEKTSPIIIEEEQEEDEVTLKTLEDLANETNKDVYDPSVLGTCCIPLYV